MAAITTQEFEHHFKSLYKPLCLFALRYTDQVDDAEDIVQQAFADVWDKNRAGNVIGNLKAYLYQAVRNRSLSFTSQPVNAEATERHAPIAGHLPLPRYLPRRVTARWPQRLRVVR